MPHKHFECKKCGGQYRSPIKVSDVLCPNCSQRAGSKSDVWMTPKEPG